MNDYAVCIDCYMYAIYGDEWLSAQLYDGDLTHQQAQKIKASSIDCHTGQELGYSSHPCELCESDLHGNRYKIIETWLHKQ